ncbi:hypothetical protein FNH05_28710 [Amycolatopsis rhizosphaerae]|uniref:Uncharacterized protein n=1 Tax=Amycolatopsis rhizosphaerae TaxID=2053003 RepID=A0A558B396_9PSEU|nr:hypothetical protein [Amycolatopsis rhizosphaerae]TVT30985.1 hypothetical protein FNH05_28710 [Amycolatopsis rhizosphaerae]
MPPKTGSAATAVSPGSPGASGNLPGASASPVSPAGAPAQWVLSTPSEIEGYPRYQPTPSQQQAITQQITSDAGQLGITGAQVSAVYQDRTNLLYSVFAGINGSGFDPSSLHAKLWQPPHTQDNGTARVTVSWDDIDPGPHGGAAICKETLTQTGMLAVEATSCYWLSPTTFGEVFLIQDPHAQKIVYNQTAANIGPLTLKIRAAVEQHS